MSIAPRKSILVPTAHDEPPIYLPLFDAVFRHADAFGFLTPEDEIRDQPVMIHVARGKQLVGGGAYVSSLVDGIPDIGNVERYARLGVREYFIFDRRHLSLRGYRLPPADEEGRTVKRIVPLYMLEKVEKVSDE